MFAKLKWYAVTHGDVRCGLLATRALEPELGTGSGAKAILDGWRRNWSQTF